VSCGFACRDSGEEARPVYDVEHTFWSVVEIARLFPAAERSGPSTGSLATAFALPTRGSYADEELRLSPLIGKLG
jgi:hypothetical protein